MAVLSSKLKHVIASYIILYSSLLLTLTNPIDSFTFHPTNVITPHHHHHQQQQQQQKQQQKQKQHKSVSNIKRKNSKSSHLAAESSSSSSSSNQPQPQRPQPQQQQQQQQIILDPTLTDDRITSLFAWISCAFQGESNYDNLMLGIVAIFGMNLDPKSQPKVMAERALAKLPGLSFQNNTNNNNNLDKNDDDEKKKKNDNAISFHVEQDEICVGAPIPLFQREQASLGAMGAAQWTGQWRTRPHALLEIRNTPNAQNYTSVKDYVQSLPRGCKRTLKKANALIDGGNVTVVTKPIYGGKPAPHSTLAHFKCVVEHEVRLLASVKTTTNEKDKDNEEEEESFVDVEYFFDALSEAVGRYVGTTRMTGYIREYRNTQTNQIIAFAHEVQKGRTIRGQWFYATNYASKHYVWFHSVQDLVRRAIEMENKDVDVVDLGPSGSDAFSELKARYGFVSVEDWPSVADYEGPFCYDDDVIAESDNESSMLESLLKLLK